MPPTYETNRDRGSKGPAAGTQGETATRLAANLELAHSLSGKTSGEVCRTLGVTRKTFWRWRRAERRPGLHHLDALAAIYDRPVGWFFEVHVVDDSEALTVAA